MRARDMNRRTFLKAASLGAAAAWAAPGALLAQTPPPPPSAPNIVYILLDDAGYGDLGCYGQKQFATPHMDRLAAEGVKFTNHYSGSAVCAPSRCSLFTGRHTGHGAIRGNKEHEPEGQFPLPADTRALAHRLRKNGYINGAFGKWGLGYPGSTGDPLAMGFDTFFGFNCQIQAHNYYPDHLWSNSDRMELDGKTYAHDLIVDRAMRFIKEQGATARPFFCYLPVTIPHASLHVPDQWSQPFRKQFKQYETTYGIYAGSPITNPPAQYAGMMTLIDHNVGQVLQLLADLGLDRNTVVMLASDNGPHKEGGNLPDVFDSNGPFRGYKRDLYEGGIRVPFLARWPGRIAPGAVCDLPCAFWDVLPTLCHLAADPVPSGEPGMDGLSLVPAMLGVPEQQKQHDYLYWELPEAGGRQALRRGPWKAVRYGVSQNPDAPVQLFNLDQDPGENTDLAAAHPDTAADLLALMHAARTESPDFPLFTA